MIPEIPWIAFVAALALLLGLFFTLKSFKMPSSFEENRKKREDLRRKLAKSQTNIPPKGKDAP
jgi:hypothetical protein